MDCLYSALIPRWMILNSHWFTECPQELSCTSRWTGKKPSRPCRVVSRKTCTWPSFRDKHRRRLVSLPARAPTPRERRRHGRTPITAAAINEGERLYNQRADIYRDANARSVLDAARIIIRFYYRLTIGRDAARSIEKHLGRRHVRKQTMVSVSPDRRSAEGKGGRNSAGNCTAAGVTVVVNSIVTSATDFIIDVARVTYKDQLVVESLASFDMCVILVHFEFSWTTYM